MALTNTLRTQVDLPVFEWTRAAPAVSSALSTATTADNSTFNVTQGRYIYFLVAAASFWKYDTWTDTYAQLASPPTAPATWSSMKFSGALGYAGRVISATANTITTSTYYAQAFKDYDIIITGGTGIGQRRVVTYVAEPVAADTGVVTAVAAGSLTDSTKAWAINQWLGYQVRITFGTGISQVRKIIRNDATSITFLDTAEYNENPLCNPPLAVALSATAGAQSIYAIESGTLTVDSNWSVQPDETSRFIVQGGQVWLASSAAATPFYTLQSYDVISDTWYIRNATSTIVSAVGTNGSMEKITENASLWERGTASGTNSTTTLQDLSKNWVVNEWVGYYVRIYSGTGEGQLRQITSNTINTLTWATVGTAPTATSRYFIAGFDAGTATSATSTTLVDSSKAWIANRWNNLAVRITAGTGIGQIRTIIATSATSLTVTPPWSVTPDTSSNYEIQGDLDKIYLLIGGQACLFIHNSSSDMLTTGRQRDYGNVSLGTATYADYPPNSIVSGTGAAGTITITTANPHNFKTGMTIVHKGDTGASAVQNNISAVITVTGPSTYTYVAPGSTAAWTLSTLSTTVLKDASKNWTVNQWVGHLVTFNSTQGPAGTGVVGQIASNTADTLTLVAAAAAAPVNGTSRYSITTRAALGAEDSGIATGTQSTTTLQDTSKTWVVNRWAGKRLKMTGATGQSIEIAIASNTSNTLTFALTTAPVAGATTYTILSGPVRSQGVELMWAFGTSDLNKRGSYLYAARGGGAIGIDRFDTKDDTWEISSTSPQIETLSTGSMYAYDGGDRWYFTKEVTQRLYYLDVNTFMIHGAGSYPYLAGTAIIGNRMEIFTTVDGLKFLWLNRHSNVECYRQLLFY